MGVGLDLPAGFRFHPTDEELVYHYLCRRCAGQPVAAPIIAELDLYKYDPWQLPDMALYGEKEWYFFSPRDRKYPNGSRPNRAAGSGYWKATGADKPVGEPRPLGIKKALVFYAGKAPNGVKTNWIMHEYRLANVDRAPTKKQSNQLRLDEWVLCRLYNKKGRIEKFNPTDREFAGSVKEERKPEISKMVMGRNPQRNGPYDMLQMEMSGLHTGSTCTDHVSSPEVTCHREVQSQLKWWSHSDSAFDALDNFGFNNYVGSLEDNSWQDIFMSLQMPF